MKTKYQKFVKTAMLSLFKNGEKFYSEEKLKAGCTELFAYKEPLRF